MYLLKLVLRGLRRHRRRGKRLFVLISLCIAAIIFSLAMRESFYNRYVDLFISTNTGHLDIVHRDGAEIKLKPWKRPTDGLLLIDVDQEMLDHIGSLEHVEAFAPMVRIYGSFFVLDGEPQGYTSLVGLDPERLWQVMPGISLVEGVGDLDYQPAGSDLEVDGEAPEQAAPVDVPVLRRLPQIWERQTRPADQFAEVDLRLIDDELEAFKQVLVADFPDWFEGAEISGERGTGKLVERLDAALDDLEILDRIPEAFREEYHWRLEEEIQDYEALRARRAAGEEVSSESLRVATKRVIANLYPDAISPVTAEIRLGTQMSFETHKARGIGALSLPVVMPVTFTGIVQVMPLYGMESFVDIEAVREYFDLEERDLTEIMIRVDSLEAVPEVKARLQEYLDERGLDYAVLDYVEMGTGFMPTAVGFKIGLGVLIGLFVFAIVIFIINMIMLAIIKRRREIGTAITLGMDRGEYVLVFLGEVFVIVTVSWIAGSLVGGALVLLLSRVGMPGVMFFIDGVMYFDFAWKHILQAYVVVLPVAMVAAVIPILSIFRLRPVEVLREA